MHISETNPAHVLTHYWLYSKADIRRARESLAYQRKQKKAAESAAYESCELAQLIAHIRKCRSGSKREQELKTQIEAITGREYYL